jgi:tRNA U34 2-thiouridine synthase MnmA/TrmU
MTHPEQKKMIRELVDCRRKMNRDEAYDFDMMLKKDKDDEDLDLISQRKLEQLHSKYIPRKSKKEIEDAWKKLTGSKN